MLGDTGLTDRYEYKLVPSPTLDPRNEEQILRWMYGRAYEASGGTLNDFSAGSPLVALYEGFGLGLAELRNETINLIPEAFMIAWLQMLGMRMRDGAAAEVMLEFRLARTFDNPYVIERGFVVTSERGIPFEILTDLVIPAGFTARLVRAQCLQMGAVGNLPPNTIKNAYQPLPFLLSVNNPESAQGGVNPETLDEAKLRTLASLRRRGLISLSDYEEETAEYLGKGAVAIAIKGAIRINEIIVYALDAVGNPINLVQRNSIQRHLQDKSLINIALKVEPVVLVDVTVRVYAEVSNLESPDKIARNIFKNLGIYIKPDGSLRKEIRIKEVEFFARKTESVLSVLSATITLSELEEANQPSVDFASRNVTLGAPYKLPKLREVQAFLSVGRESYSFSVTPESFI